MKCVKRDSSRLAPRLSRFDLEAGADGRLASFQRNDSALSPVIEPLHCGISILFMPLLGHLRRFNSGGAKSGLPSIAAVRPNIQGRQKSAISCHDGRDHLTAVLCQKPTLDIIPVAQLFAGPPTISQNVPGGELETDREDWTHKVQDRSAVPFPLQCAPLSFGQLTRCSPQR